MFADVSGSGAHGDGRNGTFLNSGGCSVACVWVGYCAYRGKKYKGRRAIVAVWCKSTSEGSLFFEFSLWLF